MKKELEQQLLSDYPDLFFTFENSLILSYGFNCQDGWFDIIDTLCKNIQHRVKWVKPPINQPKVVQVKEKFGGLHFYLDVCLDEEIRGMIGFAESFSLKICEKCGSPGKRRQGGWIKTLCDKCHKV